MNNLKFTSPITPRSIFSDFIVQQDQSKFSYEDEQSVIHSLDYERLYNRVANIDMDLLAEKLTENEKMSLKTTKKRSVGSTNLKTRNLKSMIKKSSFKVRKV
jgi:hypothetical protein